MRAANTCVFCDGKGGSAEHIFADWITEVLPGEGVFTTGGTGKRTKQSSRLASITRSVCEGCNNEWMSVLESTVRPLIQPAIEGDATVWSGAEQGTIAAWSLKTALAADSAYRERYAPREHARHLYETREVPDNVRVWVGSVAYDLAKGHYDSVGAYRNAFTAESESGNTTFAGYSLYLLAGQLAIRVTGLVGVGFDELSVTPYVETESGAVEDFLRQVQPAGADVLAWPPQNALPAAMWQRLAGVTG